MVDNTNTHTKVNRQSQDQSNTQDRIVDERDPLTFLQSVSQRLKSVRTDNPNTTNQLADDVDAYINRLGSNQVKDYKAVHREGDKERVHRA